MIEHPSIKAFWDWFAKNEKQYRSIVFMEDENNQQDLLVEILGLLAEYNPELYIEFDNDLEADTHKITITASGNEGFIPAAELLVAQAPKIEGWIIEALKQPVKDTFEIDLETGQIDSAKVWVEPLARDDNPGRIGLKLFISNVEKLAEDPYFNSAIYTLVESVLGEKSLAKDVSLIQLAKPEEILVKEHCVLLKDLPKFIEDYKSSQLQNAHQNHDETTI